MSTRKPQTLTQGKLTFGSTKPQRISSLNVKPNEKKEKPALKKKVDVISDESIDLEDVQVPDSSSEDESPPKVETSKREDVVEEVKRAPKTRKTTKPAVESTATLRTNTKAENRELNENDRKYRTQYAAARDKLNNLQPIHADGETMVHTILRAFDMSYEYGPAVGVTRLERWTRAEALGLNPPKEIKDILTTKEAMEKTEFSQSVLFNEV